MKLRRRLHGEDGTSLLLALGFIAFLGVFTVSILGVSYADFKTTVVARTRVDGLYTSDGAADFSLERFRATVPLTSCPTSSTSLPGPGNLNGSSSVSINYTCSGGGTNTTYSCGTAILSGNYCTTAKATGTGGGITTSGTITSSNNFSVNYHTNVYSGGPATAMAAGTTTDTNKTIVNGNLTLNSTCTGINGTSDPQVSGTCAAGSVPAFTSGAAPTVVAPTAAALPPVFSGHCVIAYPGKYGTGGYAAGALFSADGLTGYYLASGTYYFNDVGDITMQGWIQGGAAGSTTSLLSGSFTSRCPTTFATDANAKVLNPSYNYTGSGITIVLGGNSRLIFGTTNDTKIELFPRVPGVGSPDLAATANVTVWGRTSGTLSNYNVMDGTNLNDWVTSGSGVIPEDVVNQGFTYLPDSTLTVAPLQNDAAGGAAQFRGGVYANKIQVNLNNNTGSAAIAGISTSTNVVRTVTFTITTAQPGYANTVLTVVAEYPTTSGGQPKILSWRKT